MPRCWIGLVLVPLATAMLTAGQRAHSIPPDAHWSRQAVRSAQMDAEANAKVSWELIDFGH